MPFVEDGGTTSTVFTEDFPAGAISGGISGIVDLFKDDIPLQFGNEADFDLFFSSSGESMVINKDVAKAAGALFVISNGEQSVFRVLHNGSVAITPQDSLPPTVEYNGQLIISSEGGGNKLYLGQK